MASGSVKISFNLQGFQPVLRAQIDEEVIAEWVEDRLNDGRNEFIKQMGRGGGGGGRTYSRGRKTHSASSPGDYPKTDGGRLANSTDYQMNSSREGVLGSDVEYALYLTTGTSKMGPRKMYADALEDALKRRPASDVLAAAASFVIGVPGVRSIT